MPFYQNAGLDWREAVEMACGRGGTLLFFSGPVAGSGQPTVFFCSYCADFAVWII
jgi:hypothetical protein